LEIVFWLAFLNLFCGVKVFIEDFPLRSSTLEVWRLTSDACVVVLALIILTLVVLALVILAYACPHLQHKLVGVVLVLLGLILAVLNIYLS
jgi:hypothetical protein